jgi:hypothetical protein
MKTISIETALEEIRAELRSASPRHSCDPDPIAAAYSVLCAGHDEEVMVVTGDKSASRVFVNGRTEESDEGCEFLSHGSSEPARAPRPIVIGSTVWTVGPDGVANGHTDRIGLGTVASFHVDTNSGRSQPEVFAYIEWNDGKVGSWPVAQLKTAK